MKNIITKILLSFGTTCLSFIAAFQAHAALLDLSNIPVFMSSPTKPNVLLILDNSNSMDEGTDGSIPLDDTATAEYDGGSANPNSKSETARRVMKRLVSDYQDKLNMGLMAYKQYQTGADAIKLSEVHNAYVDISYSPSDYDSNWSGALDSQTKKFSFANPSDATHSFYTNVTAPFYTDNDEGSSFCYSPTAKALHNNEDILNGPWDTYRCFSSKTGASNALPQWQDTASETSAGYVGYKYQFELFPTDSDIAKGIYDFGQFLHWNHVGKSWYSTNSPGRGYLHVPISPVDATQKNKLDTKLGKSQFSQNKPIDPAFPLQNAGLTPLEGSLKSAKDYFSKNAHADEGYDTATCNAIPESCDKDYVILITDGLPSVADDGTRNNSIARVSAAATALKAAGIKTYVIGFALPFGVDSNLLNTIAVAGDTNYSYQAGDESSLAEAMHAILSDIIEGEASGTPIATNSQTVTDDTKAYLTSFNSADWTGNIKAYGFSSNQQLEATPLWDIKNPAAGIDPIPDHASRNIVTFKRIPYLFGVPQTPQAVEFLWSKLASSQKRQILGSYCPKNPANSECNLRGEAIVNYLRGDDSNTNTYNFRYRSNELGDIIHSEPIFVKKPSYHYPDTLETKKYSAFREEKSTRQAMLYVGANDGMLHAFNAETGIEQFAYIPSVVFNRITRLSSPAYAHEYFVDGSPTVVDAFFGNKWHSVLAGGLRAGGQGIYAIDVTDPDLNTPVKLKEKMLWEFSDYEDKDMGYSFSEPNIVRLHHGRWAAIFGNGYNNSEPDDFTSETGHAVLYIHELENAQSLLGNAIGDEFLKLDTGVGDVDTPNGFASVAPVDVDSDSIIDYVYAGDLRGNLWKFDLTACQSQSCTAQETLTQWENANNPPTLLFKAEESGTANPQPITVRPEVGRHRSQAGLMIYFGTGKYLETSDNTRDAQVTQTLYGIWDNGSNTTITRDQLQERKILAEVSDRNKTFRITSAASDPTQSKSALYDQAGYTSEQDDDIIKWGDTERGFGWALDLKVDNQNNGERIINRARLKDGRIIFSSMLPTDNMCSAGGEGYIIEVDAMQGSRSTDAIYDINGDGEFNNADKKTVIINGKEQTVAISGIKLDVGIPAPPTIMGIDGSDAVLVSGTSTINAQDQSSPAEANNGVEQIGRKSSQPLGRQSWRQSY